MPKRIQRKQACKYMLKAKDWQDCGETATHFEHRTSLPYCKKHAAFLARHAGLLFKTKAAK